MSSPIDPLERVRREAIREMILTHPILTPQTRNRILGRINGLEEAKEVARRDVRDRGLLQVLTVDLDIRIRELKRMLG